MGLGRHVAQPLSIVESFVVYKGAEPALFPGLDRAANGDLLLSFCTRFDCLPGGEGFLMRSSDDGRTWEGPRVIVRSRKPDGCINLSVGLTVLRDGTVLYPCCDARLTRRWDEHDADLVMLRSEDHGRTWSAPSYISTPVLEPFAYGRIVELADGDLLCPVWGKAKYDEPWRSGTLRSRDGGRTWGDHVTIGYDPDPRLPQGRDGEVHCAGFNETTLADLGGGTLLAVLRQQGVQGSRRDLFKSYSYDGGRTWQTPERLPLWGTSPSLHQTRDGVLVLGYRNHLGNPQGLAAPGVGLSVSRDGGASWEAHCLLPDPDGHRYEHEFEAGYPAFLELGGDRLLSLYYSYDPRLASERYLAGVVLEGA